MCIRDRAQAALRLVATCSPTWSKTSSSCSTTSACSVRTSSDTASAPVSAQVVGDHAILLREVTADRHEPEREVRTEPVNEHDRLALAGAFVVDYEVAIL